MGEEILANSRRGCSYSVFVSDVTGGTRDRPTRGVNLLVVVSEPGVRAREVRAYLRKLPRN